MRGVCLVWVESFSVSFGLRRGARDEMSLLTVNTPMLLLLSEVGFCALLLSWSWESRRGSRCSVEEHWTASRLVTGNQLHMNYRRTESGRLSWPYSVLYLIYVSPPPQSCAARCISPPGPSAIHPSTPVIPCSVREASPSRHEAWPRALCRESRCRAEKGQGDWTLGPVLAWYVGSRTILMSGTVVGSSRLAGPAWLGARSGERQAAEMDRLRRWMCRCEVCAHGRKYTVHSSINVTAVSWTGHVLEMADSRGHVGRERTGLWQQTTVFGGQQNRPRYLVVNNPTASDGTAVGSVRCPWPFGDFVCTCNTGGICLGCILCTGTHKETSVTSSTTPLTSTQGSAALSRRGPSGDAKNRNTMNWQHLP